MVPQVLVQASVSHTCHHWLLSPNLVSTEDYVMVHQFRFPIREERNIFTFLSRYTTEEVIDGILAYINASKCKFLRHYLSTFAHYAAIDAGKKRISQLELNFSIGTETIRQHDNVEEYNAAIQEFSMFREWQWCLVCKYGFSSDSDEESDGMNPCSRSPTSEKSCKERQIPESCPICLDDFSFSVGAERIICTPCF
ncbi:hypothetical protein COCNU_scaffold002135G000020 [Cocos nucifera]|nr:hypothetical protein [Cocos nucifera]